MSITVGSIVEVTEDRTSLKGGTSKLLASGTKGRVCRVMDFYCCVMVAGAGCRRVAKHHLRISSGSAPPCSPGCAQRC